VLDVPVVDALVPEVVVPVALVLAPPEPPLLVLPVIEDAPPEPSGGVSPPHPPMPATHTAASNPA
jgi:hypothetical protein